MNHKNPEQVLKRAVFMFLSASIRLLVAVVLFLVLARFWGAESFGRFMYVFVTANLLAIIVDYGFSVRLVRDVGACPGDAPLLLAESLATKAALACPVILVTAAAATWISPGPGGPTLLMTLLAAALLNSCAHSIFFSFRGLGSFHYETIAASIGNTVAFIVCATQAYLGLGPIAVAVGMLFSKILLLCVAAGIFHAKVDRIALSMTSPSRVSTSLRRGVPYAVHVALGALYFQLDTVVLRYVAGEAAVGEYQASVRVFIGALVVADVLANVHLASLTRLGADRAAAARFRLRMTRYFCAIGLAAFGALVAASGLIETAVYGGAFSTVSHVIPVLGLVAFVRYAILPYGISLTVGNEQRLRAFAVGFAAVVSLVGNLALIPRFGVIGAAYASLVTHAVLGISFLAAARFVVGRIDVDRRIAALVLAGTVAGLSVTIDAGISPLATGGFAGLCALAFGISLDEIKNFCGRLSDAYPPAHRRDGIVA